MPWKNLTQNSFADTLVRHHKALEELDDVAALIDWSAIESLLSNIHNKNQGMQACPP